MKVNNEFTWKIYDRLWKTEKQPEISLKPGIENMESMNRESTDASALR